MRAFLMLSFALFVRHMAVASGSIDGFYRELPIRASDTGQMTIALAGILFPAGRFDTVEIHGRIERVYIHLVGEKLRVIAYDTEDRAVAEHEIVVEVKSIGGDILCVFRRRWSIPASGESGAASGETTTVLAADEDGLKATDTTVTDRKGLFSPSVTLRRWRVYPRADKRPNKAPEPTTTAVTPRAIAHSISHARPAGARGAPAVVVAHL